MSVKIKISEAQYKLITEDLSDEFMYLSGNDDAPHYDGQVNVTANGKTDDAENGNPVTADKVQHMLTPQSYNRYRSYGNISHAMRESNDKNNDGIDDFYNNDELDILSNGIENDNLMKIPSGIERKVDILVDAIKNTNLKPKQQAIVLNKIVETFDLSTIPYAWKKELVLKLMSNNGGNQKIDVKA